MGYFKTEEEKQKEVRTRILRAATAMFNACKKSYSQNKCNGCPFSVSMGCMLHDHPISWENKLKEVK